ncbi:S41 family peptidase [Millionella massiliensis]|uniref:S41 family peptidase n=1 Tax=Millionella massiliensis TaxID=1871023 RepID=UPI0023A83E24|nr:S41 family peptidase [Millionella massiliensis]
MSNYKTSIRISLFIVTALLIGAALGIMLERAALRDTYTEVRRGDKLSWALSEIEERYVDPITRDSLAELTLPLLLQELDPHSVYIPASDFAATNEPLTGSFDGIGVMFNMLTDTVQITNVISGGPSDAAGIVAGDRIITVNDSLIAGVKMDQDKVVSMLRGERGSSVKLGILRAPSKELLPITVVRGAIPLKSLEAAFLVPGHRDIGYIRFGRFAASTYNEVLAALIRLREQGARKMILDLRGNGGGYLDQAIFIANEFLPKGRKIVYTEGNASPRVDQNADGRGRFQDVDLAIVIDENSASASEIVAGAIQDNDRGVIVGRRSFGKGLVQEQIPYPLDGSAMRLTIARYYTPVGRSIQKPYTPGEEEEYETELLRREAHSELFTADSIHMADSLKFVTPGGKIVYGGGGIMPDVFVPVDTTGLTPYFMKLFQKNLIFRYASQTTDRYRSQINAIKSLDELDRFFADKNLFYDFVAYAERQGVRPTESEMSLSRPLITAQIKGYIGRNTSLDETAFYYYMLPEDKTLLQAVESLSKAK